MEELEGRKKPQKKKKRLLFDESKNKDLDGEVTIVVGCSFHRLSHCWAAGGLDGAESYTDSDQFRMFPLR